MSDFFDELEAELRRATVRRAAAQRAARVAALRRVPVGGLASALRDAPGARLVAAWASALGRAPVAALVAAAVLLAASAVGVGVALRAERAPSEPARSQPAGWIGLPDALVPPRDWPLMADAAAEDELLAQLGVLRRTQRADERVAADVKAAAEVVPQRRKNPSRYSLPDARVLLDSVRRVPVGTWGHLVLLPVRPPERGPGGRAISPGAAGDAVVVLLRPQRAGLSPAAPAAIELGPTAEGIERSGRVLRVRDGSRAVVVALVPDGVARVRMHFRATAGGRGAGAVREVPVRENVGALVAPRGAAPGTPAVTWLDADGEILSRPPVGPQP